ncbi:hypothetical protein BJB45_14245 [Halomonas huangheensis]|uniref:Uncharacterized protein n=1 Tax=Halomonas huangheensis TaxID=1178482 RepID=W1N745_9GAMM|nr:hypothetical protein BJB45_14245 [Halomonas huangheensis]
MPWLGIEYEHGNTGAALRKLILIQNKDDLPQKRYGQASTREFRCLSYAD